MLVSTHSYIEYQDVKKPAPSREHQMLQLQTENITTVSQGISLMKLLSYSKYSRELNLDAHRYLYTNLKSTIFHNS